MLNRVKELSSRWSVSEKTIGNLIRKGKLKAMRVGSQWRVPSEEVARFEKQAQETNHVVPV